jgi:4-hydroxy-tetrahydrodipicolinate synthase
MPLKGVFTASLTPLNNDLSIDFPRLIRHARNLLEKGSDGLALLGTTGEANAFSVEERVELLEVTGKSDLPKDRIMIGTGCCALPDTVRLSRFALDCGFRHLLVLPPFYYKNLTDQGLEAYFSRLIDQLDTDEAKIILYNFPKLTGVPFSLPLLENLIIKYPSVISGIKDSSGDFENMRKMCHGLPGFSVFAGTEKYLLDILKIGGAGCISATANITCSLSAEIYRNFASGEPAEALQEKLTSIRTAMDAFPLIGMLKRMMQHRENESGWQNVRPPNVPMNAEDYQVLAEKLEKLGIRHS